MTKDDEAARKARAAQLHGEIDKLKKGKKPAAPAAPAEAAPKRETPAEFVHRRMRELEREKK